MKKKKIKVIKKTSIDATLSTREHYNPYQTGHGSHKDKRRLNRSQQKINLKKEEY